MKKIKKMIPYLKGSFGLVGLSLLCALLSMGSKLAIPFLAGKAVNMLSSGNIVSSTMELYIILMFSFLAIGFIFRYVFDYLTYLLGQKVIKKMRGSLFDKSLNVTISKIDSSRKGDLLLLLVNDVENVQTGLVSGFAALYDGIIAILMTIIFMFMLNWLLAIIVIGLTPLSMLMSRFVSRFNSKHFKAQSSAQAKVNAFSLESLNNSESVETLGIKDKRKEEFDSLSDSFRKNTFKANLGASIINPSTRLINAIINATLILVGAVLIINDVKLGIAFAVGDLSAFLTYASNYMQPFNEISDVIAEIDYAFASFNRIDSFLSSPNDLDEGEDKISKQLDTLKASHIDFSYDESRKIIDDFDLEMHKGQKIALVGPTGCGKTTMINLLMRFYDPQKGEFLYDGKSTLSIQKESLRSRVGMVLQDTWIFSGTVYENIAYAKEGASKEEVYEAARKAQAAQFIERLPKGYDTWISDSSGLSLGEKQLICVARVMLLEPEIVVLDEATSNIDSRTEKLLSSSFDALMKGKTSIVVAHRLSTILTSDIIVVLKDGKIIEKGNHKELLSKKGFYYNLYEAQFN